MPSFSVTKSIQIAAPIETVFTHVRDFQGWKSWSPWLIAEPNCQLDYEADGSAYAWDGKIIGSGKMTVINESPCDRIDYTLEFFKPWKSQAEVHFAFAEAKGESGEACTDVTWHMDSAIPFFMFWMTNSIRCMVGMDYERGLRMLKDEIETGRVPSKVNVAGVKTLAEQHYVGIRTSTPLAKMQESMGANFGELLEAVGKAGLEPSGPAFSIYHSWDIKKESTDYTAAIPLASTPSASTLSLEGPTELTTGTIPDCQAYHVTHTGPYRHLGNAWSVAMAHKQSKVFKADKKIAPFEVYENDPRETPEAELLTSVYLPVKG